MRALLVALLALSLGACSLLNKPDRGRLDGGYDDMGMDAGVDGGPDVGTDAGMDAPEYDAWICPGGGTRETHCGDGRDDDCDGLVDCADPECIGPSIFECCVSGTPTVTETFTKDTTGWTTAGNWVALPSMSNAIAANALSEMGDGPALLGMVNTACLHVDLGLQIRFNMRASTCAGTECDGLMDVVIGPSASFTGMLTDDLAVRGRVADGGHLFLDVMQGPTVRATSIDLGTGGVDVTIDLAPGLAHDMPAIVATVTVTHDTDVLETLITQAYVTDRDVFGTSTCHGLRLGVQGTGTHVALDSVRISQLDCSNPARFNAVRDDADSLDAVTMSVADGATGNVGWGHGGIGDPALVEGVLAGMGPAHRFMLFFDGSPVDRASGVIGHLPLAIGGADTTETGVDGLALVDDCMRWTPRGMTTSCMPESLAASHAVIETPMRVMRDPTVIPLDRPLVTINNFLVAWVGETSVGSDLSLFTGTLAIGTPSRINGPFTPTPIVGESCGSIRNPLLLPLAGTASDWLLFYVCDDMFPPVVHAATMQGVTVTRIPGLELGAAQLGPLAAQGVIDIAGVVFEYVSDPGPPIRRTPTYRLWLATRPTTTDTAVLYVEGRPPEDAPAGTIPTFTAFAGNPVLTEASSVFGACSLGCQLHGITATRITNEPTRVRLLVERWVDTGSGLTYGLVPLEQLWPSDH